MRDAISDPKYNGVDVLTELDIIADVIDVKHVPCDEVIRRLTGLIQKLRNVNKSQKIWTHIELDVLVAEFPNKSNDEVARILNRTRASVICKASQYGLKKSKAFISELARVNRYGNDRKALKPLSNKSRSNKPQSCVFVHKIK